MQVQALADQIADGLAYAQIDLTEIANDPQLPAQYRPVLLGVARRLAVQALMAEHVSTSIQAASNVLKMGAVSEKVEGKLVELKQRKDELRKVA